MEQVKDDKKFFHVFPTLRADDDVRLLFSDVEVKKITTNSRRDFLNIYIFSRHLIQKKQIFRWNNVSKISYLPKRLLRCILWRNICSRDSILQKRL